MFENIKKVYVGLAFPDNLKREKKQYRAREPEHTELPAAGTMAAYSGDGRARERRNGGVNDRNLNIMLSVWLYLQYPLIKISNTSNVNPKPEL